MAMDEAQERALVVAEAKSWIGTPYHHLGRIKGPQGGVDCAQLLALVYHNALPHRIPLMMPGHYPPDWMMHKDIERYLGIVERWSHPTDDPKPGDIALIKLGRLFCHGAIIIDPGWPRVVHSDASVRRVEEGYGAQGRLADKERKFFTLW